MKVRNCGLIKRVSTLRQAMVQNGSIDTQNDVLRHFVEMKARTAEGEEWKVGEEYEGNGISAKTWRRPEILQLITDVKAGKVNTIVVYKLDRLIRSVREFWDLWTRLEPYKVELVSITESLDTSTPMGRAMLNLLLTFAQLELEQTGARTRDKMLWRASERGLWNGGTIPLGYRTDAVKKGVLFVVPEEAKVVLLIFEKYVELGSITKLVRWLKDHGYRTPARTSRRAKTLGGGPFFKSNVIHILTNPVYIGKVQCAGQVYDGQQEPIVPVELFERVQSLLGVASKRRKNHYAQREHVFILQGILHCGKCGAALTPAHSTGRGGKPYFYYTCNKENRSEGTECDAKGVSAIAVEEAVIGEIKRIALSASEIDEIARNTNDGSDELTAMLKRDRESIEARLKVVTGKIKKLIEVLTQEGAPAFKSMKEEMGRLETDRASLEAESCRLDQQIEEVRRRRLDRQQFAETLRTFAQVIDVAAPQEKKALAGQLIDRITWTWTSRTDGRVELALYEEFEPGDSGSLVPVGDGPDDGGVTPRSLVRGSVLNGSPARTRTSNLAVNSRSLYH